MARDRGGSAMRSRGGRGSASRSRGGRGRGRGSFGAPRRGGFRASRLEDSDDGFDGGENESVASDGSPDLTEDNDVEEDSMTEDEVPTSNSYQVLLQSLNAQTESFEPARKRRKFENESLRNNSKLQTSTTKVSSEPRKGASAALQIVDPDLLEESDEEDEEEAKAIESGTDDDGDPADSFDRHFANVDESIFVSQVSAVTSKSWCSKSSTLLGGVRRLKTSLPSDASSNVHNSPIFKRRLSASAAKLQASLIGTESDVATSILDYNDVLFGSRTLRNIPRIRDIVSLHALNHAFKTRDRVIKNNSKATQEPDNGSLEIRDQGFTRPKVLVILPTRQACVNWAESIMRLSEPEQQENKSRFTDNYSAEDQQAWDEKPEDFRSLFAGNIDDDFRIGMKFTRKTVKFFSSFYNSDIILASALGLMRAIEGTDSKDKKKAHDADFLSSIEIVVVDHANAILMQNWQHVDYIFSQLNLLPKESHGCDWSRARNWYLEGNAKYLRQTIVLSDYLTPEINALASTHLHNIAGKIKYTPTYPGAMLDLPPSIHSGTLTQTFARFPSPSPSTDQDSRFTHFTTTILPGLLRHNSTSQKGTLIFIPDYASFLRIRNHLSTSLETASLSFAAVSEYSSHRDVARARSHFLSGRHSVLLYTERAHHFRRFRIRGVKRVVFYGLPDNPLFWGEVVGFVGLDGEVGGGGKSGSGKGVVKALFSKWDVMKLERVVGTERVGRLAAEGKGGDVFDFV